MSNITKMEIQQSIIALCNQGWPERRIARELGVHRQTVKRYVSDSKCTNAHTGKKGPTSQCEPHRDRIKQWYESGLSIERIHQDLKVDHGFTGSYHSVRRFVKALQVDEPARRVYRMECEPGQEAQIDYGTLYLPIGENRRLKKVHVLLVTLSHSRKSYVEAVLRQTTESFLRSLENAFRHFGGVPQRLCPDNLKAAVIKAHWYEPELNPKLRSFAEHYGTVILPARPYRPTDKGKVESGVKYVKNNALKGKDFESLAQVNEHLQWWTANIADKRIHGTTKRQVAIHFESLEKNALKPLPQSLFPSFEEGHRSVHRDSYIEVRGAYYEVPAQYIGKQVWARWDSAMVRVFDVKMQPITSHPRLERGRYTRVLGVGGCRGTVEQSVGYFRNRVISMGEHTLTWADAMIASDKDRALRRLQGLLSFKGKYSKEQINQAARKACIHGQYTLRDLRKWIETPYDQETFSFLEQHELIRNPNSYDSLAQTGELFN
jgi:transposase